VSSDSTAFVDGDVATCSLQFAPCSLLLMVVVLQHCNSAHVRVGAFLPVAPEL
jgi:hypothetical protein